MKKTITILALIPVLLVLLVTGCSLDAPDSPVGLEAPEGHEIFDNYVAIGNSLTAGFMDGGLIENGQQHSYPRLIAQKLGLDASSNPTSEFVQPYIKFPGIGSGDAEVEGNVAGVMHFDGAGVSLVGETPLAEVPGLLKARTYPRPYNNLGVPGATLHDVMNAYDAYSSTPIGNSYFNFINRESFFGNAEVAATSVSPGYQSASMFAQAVARGPSLVTVWIGNNDVLGSAMYADPANVPPTDLATFTEEYTALLQTLAGGLVQRTGFPATIVTADIPDISSIPYFIPVADFTDMVPWPWGFVEADVEFVTLPTVQWAQAESSPGVPLHAGEPIPANSVKDDPATEEDESSSAGTLTSAEADIIEAAVTGFNGVIQAVTFAVNASGYATCGMVEANSIMANITTTNGQYAATHLLGLLQAGMPLETAAESTLFSLDGIHPNNRGYGVVANAFLAKITELTGVEIENATLYPWDPTYGQLDDAKSFEGMPKMSPTAAKAAGAVWR